MRIIELDGNGMGVGGDDEFVRSSNGIYWFMIHRKRRLQKSSNFRSNICNQTQQQWK
jgi:hypothetical protein